MAAAHPFQSLQNDATCSICLDYYKDPVTTDCGHNFCRSCITECWGGPGPCAPCPQCRDICNQGILRANRQLLSIAESVRQLSERAQEQNLCEKHDEKLKLFCKEDQKMICLVCSLSADHKTHDMISTEEAAEHYKDVRSTLRRCPLITSGIEETSENSQTRCDDVTLQTPEAIRMQYKVRVTLDPDTAHRVLFLSEDGRRVKFTFTQQPLPDNPKRFAGVYPCVLGREGFSSGRHYWELQLLQEEGWTVGVAEESVNRKEVVRESPEGGVWAVELRGFNGQYWALTSPPSHLTPSQRPMKLGLDLDYEGGRLSIYNTDTMEEIYTFTGAAFSGTIYPYFYLYKTDLRLL